VQPGLAGPSESRFADEGNENAQHKRRQTHFDSKQPEQHDELEPKRDLPHAYGFGARKFRVEADAVCRARVVPLASRMEERDDDKVE
jgi:hypothetical protein